MDREPLDPFTPAVELALAIRRNEVSPLEVAECYLERMDRLDPQLSAFCYRADDQVRERASAAADAMIRSASEDLPPFHGVPLPIKDLLDVAGWPTTYGSAGTSRTPAAVSDPVVRRFVDAGFILLGKTATSEFGAVPFTESDTLGISRNPWDPERTPGGSSGGAGIAVAAAMAPIAHAVDGGASIRVPASCNGLVGLKPTRGLVTGATIELEGLTSSGVISRSITDTAAALDVLARHDPGAWWSPPISSWSFAASMDADPPNGLRIAVMVDSPLEGIPVDPSCVTAVETVISTLEGLGHHIVDKPVALPSPEELIEAFAVIWNLGGAGIELEHPDRVESHNRALRDAARSTNSWVYTEGVKKTQRLSRQIIEDFLTDLDLIVTPTMASLPPVIGAWKAGTEDDPLMALINSYPMAVFTSLFNVTGQPAISVPVHHDHISGLPVGVQVAAAPWREDLLLQVGRSLELAHPWADRRPPID